MQVEIRPVTSEEMPEFERLIRYVFSDNRPPEEQDPQTLQPEWTTCAFVDGRLQAAMGAYPFTMRWNGAPVRVAAITAVGTYPDARRQGLLRRVKQHGFAEQRERGQSVAILWASMGAIYQRFGYGFASTTAQYEFDPREIAFHEPVPATGGVRLAATVEEARDDLKRVYVEYATPRNLLLHRPEKMWDFHLREQKGRRKYAAVYRDAAGAPRGYLLYETKDDDGPWGTPAPYGTMTVHDLIALDLEAYVALWDYIGKHDLVRTVTMHPAEDDPAPALLQEPRALRRRTGDGIWMRVVDVEAALPQRPYGAAGALVLRVEDGVCDWNDGRFRVETDGAETGVARTDAEPDLSMPVRSLAMLSSGHYSASHLARWGLLEARDEDALRLADAMFATAYRPYCPDGF